MRLRTTSFWALVAALLVLGAWATAAGVRGGTEEVLAAEDGALRLWVMNNGPDPIRDMERLLAPFERRTGIAVDVELVPWGAQFDRIRAAAVSGNGPDVTQAGTTQVPYFASLGGFEDLGPRMGSLGGAEAYAPGVFSTTRTAGSRGTWAVPWFSEARAMIFRKDALRAAGIDPATAFEDWTSFRRTLRRLQAVRRLDGRQISPFGLPGGRAFDLVHQIAPFIWSAGGSELSADASRSAIDSPAAREGLEFVASLLRDGSFDRRTLDHDSAAVETLFKQGGLAVAIAGPWLLASADRTDDPDWTPAARRNLAVAPLPRGPSGRGPAFVGGSNLMMARSSKHKDDAWELIRYLSADRTQRAYAGLLGMVPARRSAQRQEGRRDPNRAAFLRALETGRSYAPIAEWGQIENAYKDRFGAILRQAGSRRGITDAQIAGHLHAAARDADSLLGVPAR